MQTKPDTLRLCGVPASVKSIEHILQIIHRNARAFVDNTDIDVTIARALCGNPDGCAGGVFSGIFNQIKKRAFHQDAVDIDNGDIALDQADILARHFFVPSGDQVPQKGINGNGFMRGGESRIIECFFGQERIDKTGKLPGIGLDRGKAV